VRRVGVLFYSEFRVFLCTVCTACGSACALNVEGFPGCAVCRSSFRCRVQGLFVHCTVCAVCGSGLRVEGFRFGFRVCGLWVSFQI